MSNTDHMIPRAAVSACVFRAGELLLVQRARPPNAGVWSLPGGSIELGETSEAAIIREIAEETGFKIEINGVVGVNDVIIRDCDGHLTHHYAIVVFAARLTEAARDPVAASDAADARFFPLSSREVASLGRRVGAMIQRARDACAADLRR